MDTLWSILISEMALETHRRRRQVKVIIAVVDDEKGTATCLQLYNQAPGSLVPADQIVRHQRIAIIKEPFLRRAGTDYLYSIRVDHFSDIVWLDDDDHRIPPKWKGLEPLAELTVSPRGPGEYWRGKE